MPTLAQVMQTGLKKITSQSTIAEAAKKMRDDRVGALLVEKKGELIGLVTETDVVRKALAEGKDPAKTSVENVMTVPLNSIQVTRSLQDAYDMMADLGVRHLVVRAAGEVIGIVSVRDLLIYFKHVSEPKIAQD